MNFCSFVGTTTDEVVSELDLINIETATSTAVAQECRDHIRMEDFYGQTINAFDFFPGNADIVLLALSNGIYVEEIDDRGWQNIQPLYIKDNLDLRVDGGRIYIKDDEFVMEIVIEEE